MIALKYHPDRNPGREAEFISKFQSLQTAYEILIDSQSRLKYDTDRARAGYGRQYGSTKSAGSKPQGPSVFTAAPPRRAPTASNKTGYPPATSYPPPPPPTSSGPKYNYTKNSVPKWDKVYDDVRTRGDAYRGFQNMKHNSHPAGGWSNFDPRTGRPPHEPGRPAEKPPTPKQQGHRPQSAYEGYFTAPKQSGFGPQRAQTTKKKNGFAPGTPGGDEPMAKSTSAYANLRGERARASSPFFEPAPSPTAKKNFTDDENVNTSIPNLERTSSRYATSGGEKTYVSSAGLGFSSSARSTPFQDPDSRPRTNPPSPTASPKNERHHSASPKLRPNRNHTLSSSPTSSDDEVLPSFRPKAVPRSRFRAKSKPDPYSQYGTGHPNGESSAGWAMHPDSWLYGEMGGNRRKAPAAHNHSGFDGWDTDPKSHGGMDSGNSTRNRTGTFQPSPKSSKSSMPSMKADAKVQSERAVRTDSEDQGRPAGNMYGSHKPSAYRWSVTWGFAYPKGVKAQKQLPLWAYPSSVNPPSPEMAESHDYDPRLDYRERVKKNHHDDPAIFVFESALSGTKADPKTKFSFTPMNSSPKTKETHRTPPKSKSHDYINAAFSAKEWNGTFKNGFDFFAPVSSGNAPLTPETVPTRGRTLNKPDMPFHFQSSNSSQEAANPSADRASSQPAPNLPETKFSADHWAELLKDSKWTVPHPDAFQSQPGDPRRKSPRKQSKTVPKRASAPRPATVTTEAEEEDTTYAPGALGGDEAMDIDEMFPNGNASSNNTKGTLGTSNRKSATAEKDTPDLLDLADISLVNPFTATNCGGINDMKDLNSTLPFESQPNTTRTRISPRDLSLPKPPKPPSSPKFTMNPGLPGINPEQILARTLWAQYMKDMAAYMNEWNRFNRTMLSHFNARQNFVDTVLSPNWMNARGDSGRLNLGGTLATASDDDDSDDEKCVTKSGQYGFGAYVRGMEEDFVVRQHWEVAWERHRQCILELGRLRTWIRNGQKSRPLAGEESLI